jgi:CHAT domain-containing protein
MSEGEFLAPLPDAEGEARTVADMFRAPTLLLGNEATKRELLAHLPGMRVLHFAGHATASTSRAGLLLADELLGGASIRSSVVSNLQLAVLSACETERGAGGSTVDPDSLVRSILRAGVPHVVASRWRVDSAATRLFMQVFYTSLISGRSVSCSLQEAEISLRQHPGFEHPYFWSAFRAFGRI